MDEPDRFFNEMATGQYPRKREGLHLKHQDHRFLMFFKALKDQNWLTAKAKHELLNLSHTPANRNEYPCSKHVLTSPQNNSIFLEIENLLVLQIGNEGMIHSNH